MVFIADILLVAGALGAAFYCMILSRRLRRFTDLDKGVGNAVAMMAAKVDDLEASLRAAQATAKGSVSNLEDVSVRAENAARHLELLVASLHSLPETKQRPKNASPFQTQANLQREKQ